MVRYILWYFYQDYNRICVDIEALRERRRHEVFP